MTDPDLLALIESGNLKDALQEVARRIGVIPKAKEKTRGQRIAEAMVELEPSAVPGGYQRMRLSGQGNFLWHSADAGLMEIRRREMTESMAHAIDAACAEAAKDERARCAKVVRGFCAAASSAEAIARQVEIDPDQPTSAS